MQFRATQQAFNPDQGAPSSNENASSNYNQMPSSVYNGGVSLHIAITNKLV